MSIKSVKRVVIAGGGTAGWCTAAALSRVIGPLIEITLVESEDIGIVGVGEATIPTVRTFHQYLGINEVDFLKATNGTFKLGIAFENWARTGDRYFHAFGTIGRSNWMAPFHHLWLEARAQGFGGDLSDYCLELQAAEAGKFETGGPTGINYAYHFDAGLYGQFLRTFSEALGVRRVEGKIRSIEQDPMSGDLTGLVLESGARIEGDLFIDCTGFKGLLIEQTLKAGWEDWSHWLPTNRALAVQTRPHGRLNPYTRAVAHDAGWRWRIPLQNRVGNGLVYCADYLSDEAAHDRLVSLLDAPALTEPRLIKYTTGRRLKNWHHNCITLGLSSGFIEPLESTSIHLFQIGVTRLIQLFPFDGVTDALRDRFNELSRVELEKVRDFVILHYKVNERTERFWTDRREMSVPDSLTERIEFFRTTGHAYQTSEDLFRVDSWLQVLTGQRVEPSNWHRAGQLMSAEALERALSGLKGQIEQTVAGLSPHEDFLRRYCPDGAEAVPA